MLQGPIKDGAFLWCADKNLARRFQELTFEPQLEVWEKNKHRSGFLFLFNDILLMLVLHAARVTRAAAWPSPRGNYELAEGALFQHCKCGDCMSHTSVGVSTISTTGSGRTVYFDWLAAA